MMEWQGLPGAELVRKGIEALHSGRRTPEALLVATAVSRLRGLGAEIDQDLNLPAEADLELYATLRGVCDDPYVRYNALRRELDSFVSALEMRRARRAAQPL